MTHSKADTPEEKLIAEGLTNAGIAFERGVKNLDFYLPKYDVYIESKGSGCKPDTQSGQRVLNQLVRDENIILVKGYEGTKSFLRLISSEKLAAERAYADELALALAETRSWLKNGFLIDGVNVPDTLSAFETIDEALSAHQERRK